MVKNLLIRLLIFSGCFFIFDKAFLFVRNSAPELEVDKRLEMIVAGKIQSDVLIYGSSRGARSVIAKVFSDSLGISAYNLSFPGSDITFHEYLLRLTLETKGNKKPKTVILVVDDSDELKVSKSLKFRLDRMYPLVKYKAIREELVRRKEKKPLLNELFVIHQLNKSNFLFKKKKFTKNDSIMPCGSMPISHQKKTFDKIFNKLTYNYSIDGELIQKVRAIKAFKNLCKKNKIELIVAIPPNFRPVSKGLASRLEQIMKGDATIWEYNQNNPVYSNPDYFFDNAHLKINGSYIYTNELVKFYGEKHKR